MKAKKIFVAGALLLMAVQVLTSCVYREGELRVSDGKQVAENRMLKGFEQIAVYGSPDVRYVQADSFSVRVSGPKDAVDDIVTEVDGRVLSIRNRGKIGILNIRTHLSDSDVTVEVTSPDLVGVQLKGSGDFTSRKQVDTDKMRIELRGSGNVEFSDIICDECTTELVGSGDIEVKRLEARRSEVSLVGSGDVELRQWNVLDTQLSLMGSGDVSVDFVEGCERASCRLKGSGDISLSGRIAHLDKSRSGSGDIEIDKLTIEK